MAAIIENCSICGKSFTRKHLYDRKYCSNKCSETARKRNTRIKNKFSQNQIQKRIAEVREEKKARGELSWNESCCLLRRSEKIYYRCYYDGLDDILKENEKETFNYVEVNENDGLLDNDITRKIK